MTDTPLIFMQSCVSCVKIFKGFITAYLIGQINGDERISAVITQIKAKMPSTDTPLWWVQANSLTKDEKNELIELIYVHRVRPLGLLIADGCLRVWEVMSILMSWL